MKDLNGLKEEIHSLYLDGVGVSTIAKQLKCSREYVYQFLRKMDDWKGAKRERAIEVQEEIAERYALARNDVLNGVPISKVVKKYGVTRTALYKMYPDIENYRAKKSKEITESLVKDWNNGSTYTEMAEKYSIHRSNIQRRIRTYYAERWEYAKARRFRKYGYNK